MGCAERGRGSFVISLIPSVSQVMTELISAIPLVQLIPDLCPSQFPP